MHADELDIDEALVHRLVGEQFREWADLPLRRVEPAGTDNAIFRLGDDRSVRLAYYTPECNPTLYREATAWLDLVLAERT
jgi:aminoglycoside phosphotransferase (APT) family kinase protein